MVGGVVVAGGVTGGEVVVGGVPLPGGPQNENTAKADQLKADIATLDGQIALYSAYLQRYITLRPPYTTYRTRYPQRAATWLASV